MALVRRFFCLQDALINPYNSESGVSSLLGKLTSILNGVDLDYDDVAETVAETSDFLLNTRGGTLFGLGSRRAATEQSSKPITLREMGIAAGGKLMQDIVQDSSPKGIWNTARARLLNIHILQPSDFEAVTHIVPPKTPITTEEYIKAGIPFYAVEEDPDQRLDGSATLAGVKSISAMDNEVVVDEADTEFDPLKPKRCATCAVRLCDCMYGITLSFPGCVCW